MAVTYRDRFKQNIEQYGVSFAHLSHRLRDNAQPPKVLANSVPKAGTNLLLRSLYLMRPLRRKMMRTIAEADGNASQRALRRLRRVGSGQIAAAHMGYSKEFESAIEELGIRHLLLVRDPRDIAVSHYRYVTYKDKTHALHHHYASRLHTDDERLLMSITGGAVQLKGGAWTLPDIGARLLKFAAWARTSNCLIVRFEDLIGNRGGGSDQAQSQALLRITDYLRLDLSRTELDRIASRVYSESSRTFEKGQVGSWNGEFERHHFDALNTDSIRSAFKLLGYPSAEDV